MHDNHDALDNLTSIDQGGQTRTYAYDALSRLKTQTTPEAGTSSFFYTDSGNLLKRVEARQVETHYQYDTLNRLLHVWYTGLGGADDPAGSRPTLPAGVAQTSDVEISYNNLSSAAAGNGLVSQISDGDGVHLTGYSASESYSYDSLSRLSNKTRTLDTSNSYTTSYQYNAINQTSVITYPSSKQVRMNHDTRGRLSGIDKLSNGVYQSSYVSAIGYSTAGQVTGMTSGSGVLESYSYSADRLQMTQQTASKSGSTKLSLTYGYQAQAGASGAGTSAGDSGQVMSVTGTVNGQGRNQTFTYDDLGRLVTASAWGSSQRTYSYDRWGNRTGMSDSVTGESQSVIVSQNAGVVTNRISSVTTNNTQLVNYSYDAAGNVINDGAHSYQYDGENRLASVDGGAARYYYDSSNRRVKRVASGYTTYYIWEGSQVIAEYSDGPASGAGGVSYYLADRLSSRVITDSSGVVKGTQDHLAYGEEGGVSGASEKHRFTNYERDSESNTDYAVNRQHQFATGRFMQADPVQGSIDNPQSFNRYTYVQNDPVNLIDPEGRDLIGILTRATGLITNWRWASWSITVQAEYDVIIVPVPAGFLGGPIGGGGGENAEVRGGGPQLPKAKFSEQKFQDCVRKLFGQGKLIDDILNNRHYRGQNLGRATDPKPDPKNDPYGLVWDFSKTAQQIGNALNLPPQIAGYLTATSNVLYFAKDGPFSKGVLVGQPGSASYEFGSAVLFHEIGNWIAFDKTMQHPKPQNKSGDTDAGAALEECMYNGFVYADGRVHPNSR